MNLRLAVQDRITHDVVRSVKPGTSANLGTKKGKKDDSKWKIMVIDKQARAVLSSAIRMYDLMDEGVTLVEPLEVDRQPLKHMEAMYVIGANMSSVEKLCEDFTGVPADPTPLYAAAHVFFLQPASDDIMAVIQGCKPLVDRLATLAELNLDFLAKEERVFSVNRPAALSTLFRAEATPDERKEELRAIADQLATACVTMKEYPIIRYVEGNGTLTDECTKLLAVFVQKRLDALKRASPDYATAIAESETPRGTLIIVDRTYDVMSPLVHEFTYQAMIYDVLHRKMKGDEYSFTASSNAGSTAEKKVLLDETDVLWPMLRHMHIADSMNWIVQSFNEFLQKNKAVKFAKKEKVKSMSEMMAAMRAMPQFQELLEKYTLHINLSSDCMKEFGKGLEQVAAVEQDMATGADENGKPVKNLIARMHDLLNPSGGEEAPSLSVDDKLRLLMLYIISQEGIKDADRKRLLKLAGLAPHETQCMSNLKFLGVTLARKPQPSLHRLNFKSLGKRDLKEEAPDYVLSRYSPKLQSLMEDALKGKLSEKDAKYLNEGDRSEDSVADSKSDDRVSLRKSKKPGWAQKKRQSEASSGTRDSSSTTVTGSRLIVFMLGGMSYNETRSAYTVAEKEKRDVLVGSTCLLTPASYIQALRELQAPEVEEEPRRAGKESLP